MFLIYVFRTLLKKDALKRVFLISLLFFAIYSFIFSGIGKFITIATMVCGFAMLHDACRSDEYDYIEVLYSFCFGIILASTLGLFKDNLPIIASFVRDMSQKVAPDEYVERFMGLNVNPNYYTMDITVALSCLTVFMSMSKPKKLHALLFVVLSVFGLMSISKSFLLIWVVLLITLLLYGIRNGGASFVKLLGLFAVAAVFIYFFAQESIETYIFRLTQDSNGDLSSLTTGRSDLWLLYIKETIKNERILLFGAGLGEMMQRAPHNTYIEAIYNSGIIGVAFYIFVFRMSIIVIDFPKKIIYYIPAVILLIRFMGIGVFVNDCLWYYLVIIALSFKHGVMIESSKSKTQIQE